MDYQNINIMCSIVEDYVYKKKNRVVKINRSCFVNERQYLLLCQAYQTSIKENNTEK